MSEPTYIAIDPGTTQSAYVVFSSSSVWRVETISNKELAWRLADKDVYEIYRSVAHLVIEMVACYGKPVGEETFETCLWIGRFIEAFGGPVTKLKRPEIKHHLCHTVKGVTDAVIRQRLLDKFGGKEKAIGKKKSPGPLYGMRGDEWQALAVAVVWLEQHGQSLQLASYARGQLTKLKRRVSNGVCPCCNRSFADLHRHMTEKHPDYLTSE